jgi:hypothetical protein
MKPMTRGHTSLSHSQRLATFFTIVAGTLQAVLAFTVLFLPFFAKCIETQSGLACRYESYTEMGGNALGYTFLLLFFALGIGAIISTWSGNTSFICVVRWLTVLTSTIFAVIGAWSIGFVFLPGGLLMLLPAISCLRTDRTAVQAV